MVKINLDIDSDVNNMLVTLYQHLTIFDLTKNKREVTKKEFLESFLKEQIMSVYLDLQVKLMKQKQYI
ncbi:MAG: hypothetical protein EOL97_15685 [Spirochaetia bacterium]|nr:hypothetical protein [Spirochaetia bacterium]